MTEEGDETNSWKDRCDRYFTSLTDSEENNGKDSKKEHTDTKDRKDREETWKSLSELKRQGNGYKHVKRALSVLDIHGVKIFTSSKNVLESAAWFVIITASIAAMIYVIYLQVYEYNTQTNTFVTTEIKTKFRNTDKPLVSFCNRNILKKSSVSGTRFADLLDIENVNPPTNYISDGQEFVTDIFESNKKLKDLLTDVFNDKGDNFISALQNDVAIKILDEASKNKNVSVIHALALAGNSDILLDYLEPSITEIQVYGHKMKEMFVRCIIDGRECKESELELVSHKDLGNCVTVQPSGMGRADNLEVIIDAESDEYLSILSPSEGVNVMLHHNDLKNTSPAMLGRSKHSASQNSHLHIDILQERFLQRAEDSCDHNRDYSKQHCLGTCLGQQVENVCDCRLHAVTVNHNLPVCNNGKPTQYVCIKAMSKLQSLGKLSCNCPEKCSETTYDSKATILNWPSKKKMVHVLSQMQQLGRNIDSTYVSNNLLKVTVNLQPAEFHLVEERKPIKLLEVFAMIGGLSALIAGISMMTLVELLWTIGRTTWHFLSHFRQRLAGGHLYGKQLFTWLSLVVSLMASFVLSFFPLDVLDEIWDLIENEVKKVQRLSDSEITSITWAMHRLRRREEEIRKEKEAKCQKRNNKKEPNIVTGNAQTRIARRNSYLTPVAEEHTKVHTNPTDTSHDKQHRLSENDIYRHGRGNMYVPNYEFAENANPRLMRVSRKTPDNSETSKNNLMHLEGIYRPAGHQIYYERVTYPQIGRIVTPADAIQLYGGSSAYFNTNQVSEPMYI